MPVKCQPPAIACNQCLRHEHLYSRCNQGLGMYRQLVSLPLCTCVCSTHKHKHTKHTIIIIIMNINLNSCLKSASNSGISANSSAQLGHIEVLRPFISFTISIFSQQQQQCGHNVSSVSKESAAELP